MTTAQLRDIDRKGLAVANKIYTDDSGNSFVGNLNGSLLPFPLAAIRSLLPAVIPQADGTVQVYKNQIPIGAEHGINFNQGANITFSIIDNPAQKRVDVTISASGVVSSVLTDSHIFVGNAANVASDVPLSGDATMANTGAITLINTGVGAALYGNATNVGQFTVDAKGRITLAANVPIVFPPVSYSIISVSTTPYNIVPTTGVTIYLADCTVGNITMNFPTAVGSTATWGIKKVDATNNTVILDPFGAQTIDGSATKTIRFQQTEVDVFSDNINLQIK